MTEFMPGSEFTRWPLDIMTEFMPGSEFTRWPLDIMTEFMLGCEFTRWPLDIMTEFMLGCEFTRWPIDIMTQFMLGCEFGLLTRVVTAKASSNGERKLHILFSNENRQSTIGATEKRDLKKHLPLPVAICARTEFCN